MADKKEEEPVEDRDYWYRLRNEQRDLVRAELHKEKTEVDTRIQEEQKNLTEAQAAADTAKAKRKIWRLVPFVMLVAFLLLFYYLYKRGYLSSVLG